MTVHGREPGALDYHSVSWKLCFAKYLEFGPSILPIHRHMVGSVPKGDELCVSLQTAQTMQYLN